MARPKLGTPKDNKVTLSLPKGWFVTVSGVTRRDYNQVVSVEYSAFGDDVTKLLANKWQSRNQVMIDVDEGVNQIPIIPQEEDIPITFGFYYSETKANSGSRIVKDQFKSNKFRTFISNKPLDAPEEMPDYMTILVFVEDAPESQQVAGGPEYDDLVLTIHMMDGLEVTAPEPEKPDTGTAALTQQGKQAIQDFLDRYIRPGEPYPTPPPPYTPTPELAALPVGIIGAGVSGLYIAMMLDSLGIKYEIMEGSERIGGRLYTHNFPKNQGPYQYYDVGAMRYPETTFMKRTFDLVRNRLNMPNAFIPYIRGCENAFKCYNDITVTQKEEKAAKKEDDIFKVSIANGGNVPPEYVAKGSGAMWDECLKDLRQLFVDYPFEEAYKKLMEYDAYSVSGYLTQVQKIPVDVTDWFENSESRTGLMDESLTETVLASLVFNDPNFTTKGTTINWFCLDRGSEIVHKAMTEKISTKPVLYQRVTAIEESDGGNSVTVTFDGRRNPNPSLQVVKTRKYSNVISTMSFGCLRMVDLRKAGLNYGQRNAIRDLMYTPSIKIGLQFKSAWWEKLGIVGGQSSTDLPIRDAVYPSYGPDSSHPGNQKSNCMIAAYNGMQDSQRLGGLMKGRDTPEERVMLDLVMRNLAQLHRVDVDYLWSEYEDYYPWDFNRDQFQLGAFCQYGPGQFKYTYPYMTQPAGTKQRLHFAGDATSTFHGWVAGALNSGWRSVMGMLIAHPELNPNKNEDIIKKFTDMWGRSEEIDRDVLEVVVNLGRTMPGGPNAKP